ncbi:hypothetical protein L3Q65_01050 (plasmid) [Amycolatopsis sp. FU40]|uniref:hypothetical protein n=1 Tax=Amycolatopsis sp. FU40 TaxID=2914159 RepID=UPI001F18B372|nr:hypothetical protein [Amycolatopsis sp. FU40]UKD50913.1 hypothetical protein L3Q65_01050 [Amycolatopsis sp. FU40]
MSVTMRARSAVLAAAAAASFAGGIGIADAAISVPAPGPGHSASADVSAPGVAARATIRSGPHRMGTSLGRPAAKALSSDFYALTTASGARVRASAPNGAIRGVTHYNEGGDVSCKVRASDGHLWGRVGFISDRSHQYVTGYMRDDLFKVWVRPWSAWRGADVLPWC